VQGSTNRPRDWLGLHSHPRTQDVFTCENVIYGDETTCPRAG